LPWQVVSIKIALSCRLDQCHLSCWTKFHRPVSVLLIQHLSCSLQCRVNTSSRAVALNGTSVVAVVEIVEKLRDAHRMFPSFHPARPRWTNRGMSNKTIFTAFCQGECRYTGLCLLCLPFQHDGRSKPHRLFQSSHPTPLTTACLSYLGTVLTSNLENSPQAPPRLIKPCQPLPQA